MRGVDRFRRKALITLVKFATCYDEHKMIDRISDKLQIYCSNECEITKYADGASLLSDYYQNYFDALFLYVDILGLNGMKIAEKIRENDTFII